MPKFYIGFVSGGKLRQDAEGEDLPGLEEAKTAALISARELLADDIKSGTKIPLEAVIIKNDRGEEVSTIPKE